MGGDAVPLRGRHRRALPAGGGAAGRRLGAPHLLAASAELADLLVDTVAGGASIGFLAPLEPAAAVAWWRERAQAVAAGRLTVWVAYDAGRPAGTVSLALPDKPNSRHRAEI